MNKFIVIGEPPRVYGVFFTRGWNFFLRRRSGEVYYYNGEKCEKI